MCASEGLRCSHSKDNYGYVKFHVNLSSQQINNLFPKKLFCPSVLKNIPCAALCSPNPLEILNLILKCTY